VYALKKQKLAQANESELEQTDPGADDTFPLRDRAGARILIGPINKDPLDLGINLNTVTLCREGTVGHVR
jgi:hypothetical protein